MQFELHPNFSQKTFIIDLPLCKILLEDECNYPWIFLIPRRPNISKIMDLKPQDQLTLLQELDWAQKIIWTLFHPVQLNVAALGNKTPQLHVHIIARQVNDPAWPNTVWDHPIKLTYSAEKKLQITDLLRTSFENFNYE